ncbi:hypothetical protein LCGC14_2162810 [marine sediment metagenome]|uniref:Uncharacterized protein n=1 Tax=marine sediment metagenome TaxID=412755 RepID=A0A0F9DSC0_9ZZZZ
MEKEEYAIILEYLPNGYPLERKMMPIAQAIGELNLTLLELVPRRGEILKIGERVYIDIRNDGTESDGADWIHVKIGLVIQ